MAEQLRHDNSDDRCQHKTAAGRRFTLSEPKGARCHHTTTGDPSLCQQHRQQLLGAQIHPEVVAAELPGSIEDFKTATAGNQALGRLFALVAGHRIPPRHAAVLAYIPQLLFNTLPYVKNEITATEGYDAWEHALSQDLRNLRRSKSSHLAETVLKQITQAASDNSRAAS